MKKLIIVLFILCSSTFSFAKENKTYSEPPFSIYISSENYHGKSLLPDFSQYGKKIYKINVTSHINGLVVKGIDFGHRACKEKQRASGNFGRQIPAGKTLTFSTGCINEYPNSFVLLTNKGNWKF